MSDTTAAESGEWWKESLKRAASRAREIGQLTNNTDWLKISRSLDEIRAAGEIVIVTKALSKAQVDAGLDRIKEKLAVH